MGRLTLRKSDSVENLDHNFKTIANMLLAVTQRIRSVSGDDFDDALADVVKKSSGGVFDGDVSATDFLVGPDDEGEFESVLLRSEADELYPNEDEVEIRFGDIESRLALRSGPFERRVYTSVGAHVLTLPEGVERIFARVQGGSGGKSEVVTEESDELGIEAVTFTANAPSGDDGGTATGGDFVVKGQNSVSQNGAAGGRSWMGSATGPSNNSLFRFGWGGGKTELGGAGYTDGSIAVPPESHVFITVGGANGNAGFGIVIIEW